MLMFPKFVSYKDQTRKPVDFVEIVRKMHAGSSCDFTKALSRLSDVTLIKLLLLTAKSYDNRRLKTLGVYMTDADALELTQSSTYFWDKTNKSSDTIPIVYLMTNELQSYMKSQCELIALDLGRDPNESLPQIFKNVMNVLHGGQISGLDLVELDHFVLSMCALKYLQSKNALDPTNMLHINGIELLNFIQECIEKNLKLTFWFKHQTKLVLVDLTQKTITDKPKWHDSAYIPAMTLLTNHKFN